MLSGHTPHLDRFVRCSSNKNLVSLHHGELGIPGDGALEMGIALANHGYCRMLWPRKREWAHVPAEPEVGGCKEAKEANNDRVCSSPHDIAQDREVLTE